MNIYELFYQPDREKDPFLLDPDLNVLHTYGDLHQQSNAYAAALAQAGIAPGDRVIAQVAKTPEALFAYFACLRLGAVYLPLNTAYQDEELAYFVADAEPGMIICAPEKANFYSGLPGNHTIATLDENGQGTMADKATGAADPRLERHATNDDDTAVILYTSGTTGQPKGAMISHGNLASNVKTLHAAWHWQPDDIMLHALPIFHIHGLFVATHLPVLNGSPIILLPAFDPAQVINLLPEATVYMGVPTNYTRLLDHGGLNPDICQKMRLFTSGSAPLLESTFNNFRDTTGHSIVERYGMTETGMNTSNPITGVRKPGTVGPPLPGVQTRIVRADGLQATIDEPGDLEIRGDNVFKGYWRKPEKTQEDFTEDGFFRTGDIATVDADGYVAIVGRNKDLIISGGLNVYPKEIESAIDRIDGVQESAVIGLPHPDFGEAVVAIVVRDGTVAVTAAEIIALLKVRLANFKVPKRLEFQAALPRNTMGKVQKNVLREQFSE